MLLESRASGKPQTKESGPAAAICFGGGTCTQPGAHPTIIIPCLGRKGWSHQPKSYSDEDEFKVSASKKRPPAKKAAAKSTTPASTAKTPRKTPTPKAAAKPKPAAKSTKKSPASR
eukprot:1187114-Prorocentrum_minimum.AAC.5